MIWLKAASEGILVPFLFCILFPWLLVHFQGLWPLRWNPWAIFPGVLLFALGLAIIWWTVQAFVRQGKGTPAPFDPPRRLVTSGLYRYVRNPMYLGATLALLGVTLATLSWAVGLYTMVIFGAFNVYLRFFEERQLGRRFGSAYEEFKRRVPRWIPRRSQD